MSTDPTLTQLLERATDGVQPSGLAGRAVRAAERRRRRRALTATLAATAAVVLVAIGVRVLDQPDGAEPAPAGPVTVPSASPLGDPAGLPQETSLNLPVDFESAPTPDPAGGRVALLQVDDGSPVLVWGNGVLDQRPDLVGRVFRHSLAPDAGAAALATASGFTVHSFFAEESFDYPAPSPESDGLWLGDSVAFAYDVEGEGVESREHEPPFGTARLPFPRGDDLDQVALDPDGQQVHEIDGGTYRRWANYQDVALEAEVGALGELTGPAAGERWVAVVRDAVGTTQDGVLLLDPLTGEPHRLLPVGAPLAGVVVHHWVDADRLLLQADDALVLWNTATDEVTRVSVLPAGATLSITDGDGSLRVRGRDARP